MKTNEAKKLVNALNKSVFNAYEMIAKRPDIFNYVVVTADGNHIATYNDGINGTGFQILTLGTLKDAKTFTSKSDAQTLGIDLYLIDADNKHIPQKVVTLYDVINKEIDKALEIVKFLEENC